jgi:predicted phosphohydrolase
MNSIFRSLTDESLANLFLMTTGTVWALSDFHLPSTKNKTMDQYGEVWVDHPRKIFDAVSARCSPNDLLLVPGDISWATRIEEVAPDFNFISTLPCTVLLSLGNHDLWASKESKILPVLPANAKWVEHHCYRHGNLAIVATRLWDIDGVFPWPGHFPANCADAPKLARREMTRLTNSLKLLPQDDDIVRILMLHFPPLAADAAPGVVTQLIEKYKVNYCVYGHVHGQKERVPAIDAVVGGTRFMLTSCDWLEMQPLQICQFELPNGAGAD